MKRKIEAFDIFNIIILVLLIIAILFPFIHIISISFSSNIYVAKQDILFYPKGFNFDSYKLVFEEKTFLRCYLNTIVYACTGTLISIIVILITAYPLTKNKFKPRTFLMKFYALTMFFNGGLIPAYLLISELGMIDTIWSIVLPVAINVFNLIICRSFLQTIPESLGESAYIDGASEWMIFLRIVVPLSKPIIAVLALYTMVWQWNSFFQPLLYLNKQELWPLSLLLRRILISLQFTVEDEMFDVGQRATPNAFKGAIMVITMLPIMCVYPFVQKYFVKGVMIGSIKG